MKRIDFCYQALNCQQDDCLLWPWPSSKRYPHLYVSGRYESAHRFVCQLAHGNPPNRKSVAAHSCNVSKCCNPRHLRWASQKENIDDQIVHGTRNRNRRKGEDLPSSKLTESDVIDIRTLYATGWVTQRELGKAFGVSAFVVSCAVRRETWKHVP